MHFRRCILALFIKKVYIIFMFIFMIKYTLYLNILQNNLVDILILFL